MSDHSYVRRQASSSTSTPVFSSSEPASRHLLLVETHASINRDEIAAAKYDNVDVIYVSRETLPQVADMMKQFNIKWRSINMLFHGSADLGENSVDMFGIKMSMNPVLMAKDPNVIDFIAFTKDVCKYTDDSLYIYTCAVGLADGFKSLCLQMDVKLASGIFLSTNITGNGAGQDWDVEWGTKTGFLTAGVHTNEIEHAQICLFKEIELLTFTLAVARTSIADEYTPITLTGNRINMNTISTYQIQRLTAKQLQDIGINIKNMVVTNANPLGVAAINVKVGQINQRDNETLRKSIGAKYRIPGIRAVYEYYTDYTDLTPTAYSGSPVTAAQWLYIDSFRPTSCFNELTDSQIQLLSPEQIEMAISHGTFECASNDKFKFLNIKWRLGLEHLLTKMSTIQMSTLGPTDFASLSADILDRFITDNTLRNVPGASIIFAALGSRVGDFVTNFPFSATQIPLIPAGQVKLLGNYNAFVFNYMFQHLNGAGLIVTKFENYHAIRADRRADLKSLEISLLTIPQIAAIPADQVKRLHPFQIDQFLISGKYQYLNGAGLIVTKFDLTTHAEIKQFSVDQAILLPVDQVKLLSIPQQDILLARDMYQYLHGAGLDVSRYGKAIVINGVTYKFTLTTRQMFLLTAAQMAILESRGVDMTEINAARARVVGVGGNLGNIGNAADLSNIQFGDFNFDLSNIKF